MKKTVRIFPILNSSLIQTKGFIIGAKCYRKGLHLKTKKLYSVKYGKPLSKTLLFDPFCVTVLLRK